MGNVLKVSDTQVNDKRKISREISLGNLVISSQYILKGMKRFTEIATLELKKMKM
jgi:hypothetical protein